jgi:ADP-ribosylglycohydrolase
MLAAMGSSGYSDRIATLVGALVGARCGLAALPAEWVRDVERSAELHALARGSR